MGRTDARAPLLQVACPSWLCPGRSAPPGVVRHGPRCVGHLPMMSEQHRPLLPQLLILLRENEERVEADPIEPSAEPNAERHLHGLRRSTPTRKAG